MKPWRDKACWVFVLLQGINLAYAATPIQYPLNDGGAGPSMVEIPSGHFVMGAAPDEEGRFPSDGPTQRITLKQPFWLSRYEITFADYDRFAEATQRAKPSDRGWGAEYWGRGNMPVFNVTWFDAVAYCDWLSQQTGQRYRLPSEAEWEYAARAGSRNAFSSGDCIGPEHANFHSLSSHGNCPTSRAHPGKTLPVGNYPANAWGLYDIHGNVFEWTADCWHNSRQGAPLDGNAWLTQTAEDSDFFQSPMADCSLRVLRGGSWSDRPRDLRFGHRAGNEAKFSSIYIGFRVLREP